MGRFVRQTGGRGQYGHVVIDVEPGESGSGFLFDDRVKGGAVPREYIPAVERGVRDALHLGVVAGYPVVDVKVALLDGSYHDVDSSEMAFRIAGSLALKEGLRRAAFGPAGARHGRRSGNAARVYGRPHRRSSASRGKVGGMTDRGDAQVIGASVPLGEMFGYSTRLRSLSQGRAVFTMQFSHYDQVAPEKESGKSRRRKAGQGVLAGV